MSVAVPPIEDIYELSPLQHGMLFETLFAPGSGVYHEQISFPMDAGIHVPTLRAAWQTVCDHHPVLRTSFHFEDISKPLQVVHLHAPVPITEEDWRGADPLVLDERLETFLAADSSRGFDLDCPPLLRLACLRLTDQRVQLVWSFHHAVLDGWSVQLVLRDVVAAYEALQRGETPALAPCAPYADYIGWLQGQDLDAAETYWRERLNGITSPTPLHVDELGTGGDEPAFAELESVVAADRAEAIAELARKRKVTLNTVVQAAWAILLSRYSGDDDVVFGAVVSGRPPDLSGVESMVGLFINTLPVRARVPRGEPTAPWLTTLQLDFAEMRRFEFSPLPAVAGWAGFRRGRRMFDSVVVFENYPTIAGPAGRSNGSDQPVRHVERTNLPLTLLVVPGRTMLLKLLYDTTRFDSACARRVLQHLENVLVGLATDDDRPPEHIPILDPKERIDLVRAWNDTDGPLPQIGLAELFERRAEERPDAPAYLFGSETLTYGETERRANRLAHALHAGGAEGGVVGLCIERSLDAAVALLAILKARGAFLPLDPTYPAERLRDMVRMAGTRLVVTGGEQAALAASFGVPTVTVDAGGAQGMGELPLALPSSPDDLCYVIFTSGSTGRPKGIAVPQRQVLNRLAWMWDAYPFAPDELSCQKTALGFVDSIWELLGPLLAGSPTVIVPDEAVRDIERLVGMLAEHRVTRIWLVPSLLRAMFDRFPDLRALLPALTFWVVSGEALTRDLRDEFATALPGATLFNLWGTSEVWDATWFDPQREHVDPRHVSIGRPIRNVQAYVLDAVGEPVPIGVPGELCIAGVGLATEYIGAPAATAEAFVPDPFRTGEGRRLWRAGDVVRRLADGTLEFLGRRDRQVKLRGFRIEPAEVETVIRSHPAARDAVVVLDERAGSARLVAAVAVDDAKVDAGALRVFTAERLPEFMVPAAFVVLEQLPLTPSGKIDRLRVQETIAGAPATERVQVAPRNELEERLAAMVADLVGVERVGVLDDFFADLGGDSLLATRLVSRVRDTLGVELALRSFFEFPNVAETAVEVERLQLSDVRPQVPLVAVDREQFRVSQTVPGE